MNPDTSHSPRRLPSPAACLAGAGVLVTLATALYLLRYACPAADDLYRSGVVRLSPWYDRVAYEYLNWTGRWSGIGLALVIFPRIDLFRWYPALLTGLIVVQALGLRAFWRILLGESATRRQVLALTAAAMAVLWAGLPSPGETWYWMTGGLENHLGIFLVLVLLGGLIRSRWEDMSRGRARARAAALAVLGLFVTGLHEFLAAMLVLVLVPGTAIVLKSRQSPPRRRAWQAACLSAVIGCAVSMLAPGNGVRSTHMASFHPASELHWSHTLALIWSQAAPALSQWVFDVRLLSATVALVLSPGFARARAGGLSWGGIPPKLVVIPAWLLALVAMFVGPISAYHGFMPLRTLSGAYTLFVIGWITAVFVCTRPAAESVDATAAELEAAGPRFARSAALGLLGVSLVVTGNTRDALVALREGVPQTWCRMVHWRDQVLRRVARGGATEVVIPMDDLGAANHARFPGLYFFEDLTEQPSSNVNTCMAMYYDLKTVRRAARGTPFAIKLGERSKGNGPESAGGPVVK